jgi:hypothetical protein
MWQRKEEKFLNNGSRRYQIVFTCLNQTIEEQSNLAEPVASDSKTEPHNTHRQ